MTYVGGTLVTSEATFLLSALLLVNKTTLLLYIAVAAV